MNSNSVEYQIFRLKSSSSSSRSYLVVGSLRRIQFSSSKFCHGLHLSSIALISRLTQSIHLCFRLPLFLLPGVIISRVFLPTHSWARLFTWPTHLSIMHLSLAVLHLSVMFSTSSLSLMSSFLINYYGILVCGRMPVCTSSYLSQPVSSHGS